MSQILESTSSIKEIVYRLNEDISKEIQNAPSLSKNDKWLLENICPQILDQVSFQSFASRSFSALDAPDKHLFFLKMVQPVLSAVILAMQHPEHEKDQKEMQRIIDTIRMVISDSSFEDLISSPELLPGLMNEVLTVQNLFKQTLGCPVFEDQGSKGITFKIKEQNKTCGYLFGTYHYLITSELHEAAKLSGSVFKRLLKCSILGTEIKLSAFNRTVLGSVEENLIEVSKKQGIVNFGIDSPIRVKKLAKIEEKERSPEQIEKIKLILPKMAEAYRMGDVEQLKALSSCINMTGEEDKEDEDIEIKRDACIAQNIELFLNIAKGIGKKRGEAPFKAFFAIGTDHLLREGSSSIPSLLAEKGWTLTLVNEK